MKAPFPHKRGNSSFSVLSVSLHFPFTWPLLPSPCLLPNFSPSYSLFPNPPFSVFSHKSNSHSSEVGACEEGKAKLSSTGTCSQNGSQASRGISCLHQRLWQNTTKPPTAIPHAKRVGRLLYGNAPQRQLRENYSSAKVRYPWYCTKGFRGKRASLSCNFCNTKLRRSRRKGYKHVPYMHIFYAH